MTLQTPKFGQPGHGITDAHPAPTADSPAVISLCLIPKIVK